MFTRQTTQTAVVLLVAIATFLLATFAQAKPSTEKCASIVVDWPGIDDGQSAQILVLACPALLERPSNLFVFKFEDLAFETKVEALFILAHKSVGGTMDPDDNTLGLNKSKIGKPRYNKKTRRLEIPLTFIRYGDEASGAQSNPSKGVLFFNGKQFDVSCPCCAYYDSEDVDEEASNSRALDKCKGFFTPSFDYDSIP